MILPLARSTAIWLRMSKAWRLMPNWNWSKRMIGEAHRLARREQAGERDVERKDRVVLAAEAAADIGAMGDDVACTACRAHCRRRGKRCCSRSSGALHADHEFEPPRRRVVPGERALRLEEDLVDRLGLEAAVEDQRVRRPRSRSRPGSGRRRSSPAASTEPVGEGTAHSGCLLDVADRLQPAGIEGGIDVIAVRRRPGDAHEVRGAVGRPARSGRSRRPSSRSPPGPR